MRILHVTPSVGPARGGPSQAVLDMCKGLADAGIEITLVTTNDNGPDCLDVPTGQPIHQNGYDTYYFQRQSRPYTISMPLLRWISKHVAPFDLVHVHAVFSHISDWTPPILHRYGTPYGITPHGILCAWGMQKRRTLTKRLFRRFLVKPNLKQAAFVHFTSMQELREVSIWEELPQGKVIPLGLPLQTTPQIRANRTLDGTFRLLYLSRIDPIKGLELLLQAVAQMRQNGYPVHLTIAGSGKPGYVRAIQNLSTQLGISSLVEWTGFVSGQRKQTLLENSDVFVLPSYSENFSVAVVEAMAVGLPVIISDRVGIAPDVKQARAGLVIPCEVNALVAALVSLVDNPGSRQQMGLNGHQLARERFSIEAATRDLIAVYEDMLQPKDKCTVSSSIP